MRPREAARGAEVEWLLEARRARWTQQVAEAVFHAQEAAGSSLWAFCQQHGLSYARVRFWKQRRGRPEQKLSFVPVSVSADPIPAQRAASGGLELEVAGVRVHVGEGASQELIGRVVRALKEGAAC